MSHTYKRSDLPEGVGLDLIITEGCRLQSTYYRALQKMENQRAYLPHNKWTKYVRGVAVTLGSTGLIETREEGDQDILSQRRRRSHYPPGYVYCRLLHHELVLYLLEKYEHREPVIED